MHITASVFINDDERDLHAEYEERLEGLAPQAPISQYLQNCTREDACPELSDRNADAHRKHQTEGRDVIFGDSYLAGNLGHPPSHTHTDRYIERTPLGAPTVAQPEYEAQLWEPSARQAGVLDMTGI